MATDRIKISRKSDSEIAAFFKELGTRFKVQTANLETSGFGDIVRISPSSEAEADRRYLLELDSYVISKVTMEVSGLQVVYCRDGQYPPRRKVSHSCMTKSS